MNLWGANQPRNFWQCQPDPGDEAWEKAIAKALPCLGLTNGQTEIDSILVHTLGEGRYGPNHWELGTLKRIYYQVKGLIPRSITRKLRRLYNRRIETEGCWPIEQRYVNFLREVLKEVMVEEGVEEIRIKSFWREGYKAALVLTHDVETAAGQKFVEAVAGLEEKLGFRSLFNFVPERYEINHKLMNGLRQRGFEVGVHGLKHNGRLFTSKSAFMRNAARINKYLLEWDAHGFRAELTHRQPEWMQALEVDYDLSFFDTDPYEPIPGGTMSIYPFYLGHFIELPYTLVQDYTLTSILGETTPRMWLEKVDFIEKYNGMALVNTHPDYLKNLITWGIYEEFLLEMKKRSHYWHALPKEVCHWWRIRSGNADGAGSEGPDPWKVRLAPDGIVIQ